MKLVNRALALALYLGSFGCGGVVVSNNVAVPTGATPQSATTAAPSNPAPAQAASGSPSRQSQAPASAPSAPSDSKFVQNININVTNVVSYAYAAPASCGDWGLTEGTGYCSTDYLVFCSSGIAYELDCTSYGADVGCGYIDDGAVSVTCVDKPTVLVSQALEDDVSYAYQTSVPCSADEEGEASCSGDEAVFCTNGSWWAIDCTTYVASDGTAAACGVNSSNQIDCFWK